MLSIITPVLNGSKYIEETILSVRKLGIPYEHIVVDGGSTDTTVQIVEKFDKVRLVFQSEKTGMYGAIQQGFIEANGQFIAYVNSDDVIVSEGYEAMYNLILEKGVDFVYSNAIEYYPTENNRVLVKARLFAKYFLRQGYMPFVQPSSIYKKHEFMRIGGFNFKDFRISGDLDLFQRMAFDKEIRFCRLNVVSSIFLKHGNSLGDRSARVSVAERDRLRNHNHTIFNRLLFRLMRYF